jgi:hypothetical protein
MAFWQSIERAVRIKNSINWGLKYEKGAHIRTLGEGRQKNQSHWEVALFWGRVLAFW